LTLQKQVPSICTKFFQSKGKKYIELKGYQKKHAEAKEIKSEVEKPLPSHSLYIVQYWDGVENSVMQSPVSDIINTDIHSQ
jgi:hypothetical protein